ncbi:hypothetical protein CEP54_011016 [Fusarium duplospermum]|uniref:Major facilitator superfamily (MFS) profile domain-containing protein n=1 Tax=Fusarium duplospermum TaxID=1325734 RepID=A0A428PGS4_9HYPO|nr:hypothetical protein CEP54_011016 [Fusarium duplospermum]
MRPLSACKVCRDRQKKCIRPRCGTTCVFCSKRGLECDVAPDQKPAWPQGYAPLADPKGVALHASSAAIPDRALSRELIDLFFIHIHFAFPTMFHMPSFKAAFQDGTIPRVLFFAVIGLSARFSGHRSLSHINPWHRGRPYNNFWWVGNILAGWVTYGTNLHIKTSWAWRIPTILQAGFPSIAMALVLFLPESPRWLISKDRTEEALAIFAKYRGEGDPNSPIVQLQYQQILEEHNHEDPGRWWDYRELVDTRSARYRIMLVVATAFFGQWSGNNVISYFLPEMLKKAGMTNSNTQLLINAINAVICWIAAMCGSMVLDKFGRRKMMMSGLMGCLAAYIMLTGFAANSNQHKDLVYGLIVAVYLFGICFATGMTPSATLYPMECLPNRTRAKGSSIKFLFMNIATMSNTYGISVGIKEIGWKLYLVYIVWIALEIAFMFVFFVETKGKNLEELSEIFEAKNPRKASTKKVVVALDETGHVVDIQEAKKD